MLALEDFKVGDVLKITSRSKRGSETRGAIVSFIGYRGTQMVAYTGYRVEGCELTTGSGAFVPSKVGSGPYGFVVAVEIVGHTGIRSHSHTGPRPGDRHYDLMCG